VEQGQYQVSSCVSLVRDPRIDMNRARKDSSSTPQRLRHRSVCSCHGGFKLTVMQSALDDIRSEVKNGRRSGKHSDSREGTVSWLPSRLSYVTLSDMYGLLASRTSDYMDSDLPISRHRRASDLSNANRSQSYGMSPPPKPDHRAGANNDGDPLSRYTSRAESAYGREYPDGDSAFGSQPSPYASPTLPFSRMVTQPIAIPTGQRRPSVVSQDSSDSFDEMYGCLLSAPSGGRHSCETHRASQER
jgi:hypothetical protein